MSYCPNCGSKVPEYSSTCPNCGGNLTMASSSYQPVPHYDNGGLIAWSIVTLLLCTIPGIVGLVKACKINNATSYAEQQKMVSSCKTWCTIGTIIGAVLLVLTIIGYSVS